MRPCPAAQQSIALCRRHLGKLHTDPDLVSHIVAKLQLGWSPKQVCGRLALDGNGRRLCHETIYGEADQMRKLSMLLPCRW